MNDQKSKMKIQTEIVLISLTRNELKDLYREVLKEELSAVDQRRLEKELLNFKETQKLLGISSSMSNKLKRENAIPYKRLGKRVLFNRQDVLNALKDSNYSKFKELR